MRCAAVPRRNPRQERSKITVNAILEAAAREGYGRATTNLIARRAGVSVGSLYQYFPDKLALLSALHAQLHDAMMAEMAAACRGRANSMEDALAAVIAVAAAHHRANAALERAFARNLPRQDRRESAATRDFQSAMRELLRARCKEVRAADQETSLLVLRNLGRAVMHESIERRPGDLDSGVVARELLRGALAFLK